MSTIVGTNIEVTNLKYDSDTTSMIISNAGQVTIQGEGTATTNLQQGLLKCTMDLDGTGTISLNDSFNISSVADNATGKYTPSYNNNFGNTFYGWSGTGETAISGQNGREPHQIGDTATTSSTQMGIGYQGGSFEDCPHIRVGWWGGLA
tara:strand:+ start:339 stop:785 length:447 start_codon:yes stop_codon:yes gene_type:complete